MKQSWFGDGGVSSCLVYVSDGDRDGDGDEMEHCVKLEPFVLRYEQHR